MFISVLPGTTPNAPAHSGVAHIPFEASPSLALHTKVTGFTAHKDAATSNLRHDGYTGPQHIPPAVNPSGGRQTAQLWRGPYTPVTLPPLSHSTSHSANPVCGAFDGHHMAVCGSAFLGS